MTATSIRTGCNDNRSPQFLNNWGRSQPRIFLRTSVAVTPEREHVGLEVLHAYGPRTRITGLVHGVVTVGFTVWGYNIAHLARCSCGTLFAYPAGPNMRTDPPRRCLLCKRANAIRKQRERRARRRAAKLATKCANCGQDMAATRKTRRYCSPACRQKAHRQRLQTASP